MQDVTDITKNSNVNDSNNEFLNNKKLFQLKYFNFF